MIITALFILLAIFAACGGQWIMAVVFGVISLFGIAAISDEIAHYRARVNRDRYWAYGEEPDWKRKQRLEREKKERMQQQRIQQQRPQLRKKQR